MIPWIVDRLKTESPMGHESGYGGSYENYGRGDGWGKGTVFPGTIVSGAGLIFSGGDSSLAYMAGGAQVPDEEFDSDIEYGTGEASGEGSEIGRCSKGFGEILSWERW